jgi:hypothetical protein
MYIRHSLDAATHLIDLVPNLKPGSVRPGDVLLHKHKPSMFIPNPKPVVDYSDRRLRFDHITGRHKKNQALMLALGMMLVLSLAPDDPFIYTR